MEALHEAAAAGRSVSESRSAPRLRDVEQFVFQEARLIDEQRWSEWADLFTADGIYWVPAAPDQPDPLDHVSLMYEDSLLRSIRLRRYTHPNAISLQPSPRSLHLVSNVMLDSTSDNTCTVNSRQIMVEYRRDHQQLFAGSVTHQLVADGKSFKMESKRVDLINCDGSLESIQIYL